MAILIILCLAAMGVFLLPILRRRAGRRSAGMFSDEAAWRNAMEQRAAAMLRHMPAFPEEDTLAFRIALRRNGIDDQRILRRRSAKLLLAAGHAAGRNPALFEAGREFAGSLLQPNGEWKIPIEQAEDAFLAYAVLSFPGMDLEYIRPAMEYTAHLLQSLAGEIDTIPADTGAPNLRFARTIGDVCPFLSAYAVTYGEPFYLNLAMRQLNEYLLSGMHPIHGLPAEGIDRNSGLPIGAFGWSSACAAVAFGMMEISRYLPGDDARHVKLSIHSRLLAERLCTLWGKDGSFPCLPSSSLPDTEAAAVLAVFLWDTYEKTQNAAYLDCVKRAMADLRKRTRKNGMVDFAQPETLRPGFYWDEGVPTAGALAASIYAAVKMENKGKESLQTG